MSLPRRFEAPVFFTSAAKVKIPFVGDDTRGIDLVDTRYYPISNPLEKHHHKVSKHFVRMVSNDVRFDDNVVHERCAHSMPYKSQDFSSLYQPSFAKESKAKSREEYPGRFDAVGYNRKMPGFFKKVKYPEAFKDKKEKHDGGTSGTTPAESKSDLLEAILKPPKKTSDSATGKKPKRYISDSHTVKDWDQAMLEKLSKDTAHWIVHEGDLAGNQKAKLGRFLRDKYGDKVSNTHIVRPDISETDLNKKNELMEVKREKHAEKLESIRRERNAIRDHKTYKKSLAEYYKLPRFLSQQQSFISTSQSDVNQSAQSVIVKHLEPSPPPKMEDFLVGVAGQFMKSTDNEFEQRLYTEQAKPVHQVNNDKSRVVMDDLSEYKVDIRPQYPLDATCWTAQNAEKKSGKGTNHRIYSKGLQRWASLPKPADFMSERGLNPPMSAEANIERVTYDKFESVIDNRPLVTLVEEWRSNWKLVGQWQDIPISEVLIDMDSLHDNIRLGAVAACAMASLHKKPINELAGLAVAPSNHAAGKHKSREKTSGHLPKILLDKVREKLHDANSRVKLAAAICLYSLNSNNKEIFGILKCNMNSGYSCDRLAAAQCLALSDDVSAEVIRIIVQLLLENNDSASSKMYASQKEQATMLLVHLSKSTNLVHSLLAEQLNSSRWRDRVTACQVIGKLAGNINKDMVHKLTNLMWNDWSSEVRKVAAETLGHTGHGRDIHYELRTKLAHGNEALRVNVLNKLSHLGIMTAALLPTFMGCFSDPYVSVRIQACKTAGSLQLTGEEIGKELLNLMEFDPSWKVKAHAITAMQDIEYFTEKSLTALMWALRFEDEPDVRMRACVALRYHFQKKEPDFSVLHILQDRALVEPDPAVRDEVQNTLKSLDAASQGDNIEMIRQIKSEVKRLCHKGVIAAKIAMYEKELERYQNKVHYMGANLSEGTQSPYPSHPCSPVDIRHLRSPRSPIAAGRQARGT